MTHSAPQKAEKLRLGSNHFYFLLLAGLYEDKQPEMAGKSLKNALRLAHIDKEKQASGQIAEALS